ncbi:putative kinesin [Leishmania major strain Friedlin]|uniref:Putative kinesin n=1 Tax=Leishmania major TaxID=5664 RepID=Q4QFQ2_LEIMA|nr:putative kinesin [Leishmania major strain Friedlin]CAG9571270.1 kinesin_-_putative [Leishmania major strain Friedlin]CAJ03062.1 putative kinesin [Leishmania major strain Friedlin]|eukprot:XP_001687682.1 putative kinesin [Leishmania major strain Friedlin]
MKDVGGASSPLYDNDWDGIRSSSVGKLLRQDGLPLLSNARSVTTASKRAGSVKPDMATGFRIVVAARIRPFTELEVHQWRQERRVAAEEREDAAAGRNGSTRSASRQPFGSEHKSSNATSLISTTHAGATPSQELRGVPPDVSQASPNVDGVPLPVVEVESNGRTIVLLNPKRPSLDTNATAPARNAFTYDYVYSSFTPRVELDSRLTGGLAFSSTAVPRAAGGEPYIIDETTENAFPSRASWPQFSEHTPEQERQAEAEQVAIYEQLAIPLVDAALQGYNTCMFAYGQTGSGKTYTMMGTAQHPGLIPRLCQLLLSQVAMRNAEAHDGCAVSPSTRAAAVVLQLSYMEIYNEQVRDLLKQRPKNAILRYRSRFDHKDMESDEFRTLKVRHHPSQGIYVEGLTTVPVSTWAECEAFLHHGNALRTQYSTAINAKSSRSHAIFQFQVTQREGTGGRVRGREVALETCSKINLVDLAGSERNTQSKTTGKHLAEANSINASLSTLRRVLDGLVNNCGSCNPQALAGGGKVKKGAVIPYRESLLTYVLSDNLGGNSLTVMCANVSPSASNISETESTLRYATLARGVVNHARLNEAPTALIIREMREQIKAMQEELRKAPNPAHVAELTEGILLSEQLLREMRGREKKYELRLQSSEAQQEELRKAVASHQAGEAYWRAEAQRQQEELESLRSALVAITASSSAADAIGDKKARSTGRASKPCHVTPPDRSLRLPQLHQGTAANGARAAPAPPFSADGRYLDGEAVSATRSPLTAKKKQSAKKHMGLICGDGGIRRDTAVAYAVAADFYSPGARKHKLSVARGTPLSLIDLREQKCRPGAVLPHLRGGSSASAPCKARRENSGLPPEGASQPLSRRSLSSERSQRFPHPPSQHPQRSRYSNRAPIRRPPSKQNKGDLSKLTTSTTEEEAPEIPLTVGGRSGLSALHNGGGGGVARDSELDEVPSFYQTVTYLTAEGAALEGSSSVATSSCALSLKEGGEDDQVVRAADSSAGRQRPGQQRKPRGLDVLLLQADVLELQQQRADTPQSSRCNPRKAPEIEGEAATPTSSRRPTNSPGMSEACQAQAVRGRRRSPVDVESGPNKKRTKASQGTDHKYSSSSGAVGEDCRLSPSPSLPAPQQQQASNGGGSSVRGAATVDDRKTMHRQPAAVLPAGEESGEECRYVRISDDDDLKRAFEGESDGDVAPTASHPRTFSGDDDAGLESGCMSVFEGLTDMIPADSSRGCLGHRLPYATVAAAAESAVASAAAAVAPSPEHALSLLVGRKLKQNGGAQRHAGGSPPSCAHHYSAVGALSPQSYW